MYAGAADRFAMGDARGRDAQARPRNGSGTEEARRRLNMRMGSRQFMLAAAGITVVSLIGVALAASGSRISTRSLRQSNGQTARQDVLLPVAATGGFALASAQAAAQA